VSGFLRFAVITVLSPFILSGQREAIAQDMQAKVLVGYQAILKTAPSRADAPAQGYWLTLDVDGDNLPNDWYLRLAGEIGRMFRAEAHPAATIPAHPGPPRR
jgi:hypothetical protein